MSLFKTLTDIVSKIIVSMKKFEFVCFILSSKILTKFGWIKFETSIDLVTISDELPKQLFASSQIHVNLQILYEIVVGVHVHECDVARPYDSSWSRLLSFIIVFSFTLRYSRIIWRWYSGRRGLLIPSWMSRVNLVVIKFLPDWPR